MSMGIHVMIQSLRLTSWRRPVRTEFIRQCYYTGVGALNFIVITGALLGLALISQLIYWLNLAGQDRLIGEMLAIGLVHGIAPLLVMLMLIGRSGTAITAEIGVMKMQHRVRLMQSLGVDPLHYLIVPRAAAMGLCAVALTIIFFTVTILCGYLGTAIMGIGDMTWSAYMQTIFEAFMPRHYLAIVLKPMIGGFFVGIICCMNGMEVEDSILDVPRRLPRCFVECLLVVFSVFATFTLLLI